MSLVEHARRELTQCGQYAEDPAYAQSIIAAVAAFASYGHSGGSAGIAIHQLTTLLQLGNLSPLTDDPDEWHNVTDKAGEELWQNRRNSEAFSTDGGKTYYLLSERDGDNRPMHTSEPATAPPRTPPQADELMPVALYTHKLPKSLLPDLDLLPTELQTTVRPHLDHRTWVEESALGWRSIGCTTCGETLWTVGEERAEADQ
ncbi:hypothetical protein C1I95_24780 [Micromonospora craterilacus]|uniref:Uncharacterized protein n=1 Tax=Micromonospora craterilacus TaxID=1655439 RepID=A0A2W2DRV6_9ACTN|nr:hypothetical protein [Micromonospora craterilacus]PZG12961.1 hypothetical protein C1I95_24780 [Micromonospora craterilacus]